MARKFAAVVFSVGCLHASSALALGLGELSLESFLNEPLKAKVDLLNTDGLNEDQIRIRLATKEDFKKLGIDRAYFLTNITFEVDVDASGRGRIILTSQDPVLEPYLDFIVEARWPSGRLLREYTILVDPPVFDSVNPVISASERVEAVEGIPAPAKKPSGAKTGSGTRVDIKTSDLAPGAMPARDYSGSTAGQPSAGERYMINRDDTLWKIAVKGKPPGVSVHQAMLDIQRLNPNAFIDGNINRIKAGYILYLPDSSDISSADEAAAVAEVQQQNEDWRDGAASQPAYDSGPSLRISSDADDSDDVPATSSSDAMASASNSAALEDMEKSELERAEMAERLTAMTQQVETLQRIVNLKDDQIAALQGALAEESGDEGGDADEITDTGNGAAVLERDDADAAAIADLGETEQVESTGSDDSTKPAAEDDTSTAAAPEKAEPSSEKAPAASTASAPAQESGGVMGYLKYIIGAAVAGLLALFFIRRRRSDDEQVPEQVRVHDPAPVKAVVEAPVEDVFADIELQDQELDLDESAPETELFAEEVELAEQELPEEEDDFGQEKKSRGYGGRKHDEYASDVDTGDALAEADIYIAYGRFPQAIDLLRNAIANEPNNPAYHLKLLEIHAEAEDSVAAMEQFAELKAIGDAGSVARAEEVLAGIGAGIAADKTVETPIEQFDNLALEDTDLTVDTGEVLEADFTGLEIEQETGDDGFPDELDLSADFEVPEPVADDSEEDLVIAAETNGFSTKLDLARAYLDMGDEDGARQILQEVEAEGSDTLKAEAQALLARID